MKSIESAASIAFVLNLIDSKVTIQTYHLFKLSVCITNYCRLSGLTIATVYCYWPACSGGFLGLSWAVCTWGLFIILVGL